MLPVRELALIVLVTCGAVSDLRTGKIPNALTYPACAFGLVLGVAGGGFEGLLDSVGGLALAFVPFFVLYLAGGMGGGDVKMMAAVGALMGLRFTALAMVNSVFVGALIALLIIVWERRIQAALRFLWQTLRRMLRPGRPKPIFDADAQVPFGVAICLASFLTLVASWHGARSPWHGMVEWGAGVLG